MGILEKQPPHEPGFVRCLLYSVAPVLGLAVAISSILVVPIVLRNPMEDRWHQTLVLLFYLILFRDISAKWLLAFWFVSQFLISPNSGVAWAAHVGGFVFGALVALVLRRRLAPPARRAAWEY